MARPAGTGPGAEGTSPIDRYVARMERSLRGPSRVRADIVQELRDGLEDAAGGYAEEEGLDRDEAEELAVEEFGDVSELAPDLQIELSFAQGRRTGWMVCLLIALQAFVGQFAWQHDPDAVGPGVRLGEGYHLLAQSLDWFQYSTLAVALLGVLFFGWGGRLARVRPRVVGIGALFAVVALVVKSTLAVLLVALVPGMLAHELSAPMGMLKELVIWVVPTLYVMGSAVFCLRVSMTRPVAEPAC
ncbi:permease prefix domain 1-containing protein [Actinomadura rupiterrae]|uniref:permease prefix domain 1-containing protein n=1 Tax=Actinomadura rupiterrae TaxID=559627 RepID=UPI0020A3094F|nr:permease prefix domain 1-containing protein [Actinomadura rupiterrae]MCP2341093.1 hypothetical protein [Actinomadura rupiterrae]